MDQQRPHARRRAAPHQTTSKSHNYHEITMPSRQEHKNASSCMSEALTWGRPAKRQWMTESRASTRYTGVPVGNSQAAREYDENAERLTNPEKYADAPLPPFSPKTVTSEQPVEITVKQPIVMLEPDESIEEPLPKASPKKPIFHCYGNGNVEPAAGGVLWGGYLQTKNVKCQAKDRKEVSRHALRAANRRIGSKLAALSPPRARVPPSPQVVWTRRAPTLERAPPPPPVEVMPPPPPLPPAGLQSQGWSEGGTALALRWVA